METEEKRILVVLVLGERVVAAVAVAAAVTVVEVGAAEVLGIVAAAPNQVLVSHLTTKVRP